MGLDKPAELPEEWRDIAGYDGKYQVSNLGRFRSMYFINGNTRKIRSQPKMLAKGKRGNGYWGISLSIDGKSTSYLTHKLVLEAYVGPRPKGKEAAHLDGDRSNDKASNLRWCTKKENHAHKWIHGTQQTGERNGFSKLTEEQVKEIRLRHMRGESQSALGREFGVKQATIWLIVARKGWKHVA